MVFYCLDGSIMTGKETSLWHFTTGKETSLFAWQFSIKNKNKKKDYHFHILLMCTSLFAVC